MMKILFITHKFYPEIGGIEVNSEILANQFTALGAVVKVVTWTADTGEKTFDYNVIRAPSLKELYKLFQWSDVVYENNPVLKMSWLNIIFKRPRVVAIRTWIRRMDGKRSLTDWLKKIWVNNATAVIAISEAVKKDSCKKAIVIGNPYRSNLFKANTDSTLSSKDFIFLGRLVSDKGADMCIELIHRLKENFGQECSLSIVGYGPEMEKLEYMSKKYNLEKNINFCGFLKGENLANILNQHRFLLVPSRWAEPFGNVALEGMASGCIAIVSDGGGLPDAVGNAGIVFERNSVQDLVSKTHAILSNSKEQKALKKTATKHLENHTETVIGQRYFEVLLKVLNK
jgi:glycosyltransferase involved in cell wall biosynthesis